MTADAAQPSRAPEFGLSSYNNTSFARHAVGEIRNLIHRHQGLWWPGSSRPRSKPEQTHETDRSVLGAASPPISQRTGSGAAVSKEARSEHCRCRKQYVGSASSPRPYRTQAEIAGIDWVKDPRHTKILRTAAGRETISQPAGKYLSKPSSGQTLVDRLVAARLYSPCIKGSVLALENGHAGAMNQLK